MSFSGGKDSTVLLDIVRKIYPDVEAVFIDTGLEYPEIRNFVRTVQNVQWVKPDMNFRQVIDKYGYPLISKEVANTVRLAKINIADGNYDTVRVKKMFGTCPPTSAGKSRYNHERYKYLLDADFNISEMCCDVMKKRPAHKFTKQTGKKPIIATMTDESLLRLTVWLQHGCNSFDGARAASKPMSFWTEQDVLQYLKKYNVPYASIYGDIVEDGTGMLSTTGVKRTGCIFCGFGCHLEDEPNRFQKLAETHPTLWRYCMKPLDKGGLGMREVLEYIHVNPDPAKHIEEEESGAH